MANRKKTGKNKQSKNNQNNGKQKNKANVNRPDSDRPSDNSGQARKEPIEKEPINELIEDRAKKELTEKKADGKTTTRSLWNNAWVKYQRKRIVTKFGSLKKRLTGGRWDRRMFLSCAGIVIVLVAVCGMLRTFLEYHKSDRIYGKAESDYVTMLDRSESAQGQANGISGNNGSNRDAAGDSTGNGNTGADGEDLEGIQTAWHELVNVDVEGLQAAYPDVAGWLYFENESISYPIMYSGDNEKYLRTTYTGKQATAGSIFLDGENTRDFSDPHTLIYGHNMKNLSMFGRLRYYRTEKGYYDEHRYFQIFTSDYIYRYEIFAYGQVPADSSIYYVYGAEPDAESFKSLIKDLKKISMQDTGVSVGPSDHIVTLSTCTGDGDVRMIVSAVRVDEKAR